MIINESQYKSAKIIRKKDMIINVLMYICLAVVSRYGQNNPVFTPFWRFLPKKRISTQKFTFSLKNSYFHFNILTDFLL